MNRRAMALGAATALAALFVVRLVVNESHFPDRLVAPLLIADTTGRADAMVVMGAGVIGDCVPNLNGVRRVLLALRLWKEGRAPVVVFTGGTGERSCPVAEAMARMAREVGIAEKGIRTETVSRNTHENADLTAPLLRRLGADRVLVVTDRLHMPRAAGAFSRLGFGVERASVPVWAGHNDNVDMLLAAAREFAALTFYRVRGWVGPVDARAATPPQAVGTAGAAEEQTARRQTGNETRVTGERAQGPIVVLGASYAGSWPLRSVGEAPVVNRGVNGEQSFEMLARFDRDVVAAAPRAVVLWGFINDIFRAAPDGMPRTTERIRDSYTRMIARAREHGIEPIIATEVTIRPKDSLTETLAAWVGALLGKQSYQDRINAEVVAMNRWLSARAAQEGLLLLDLQAALADSDGVRRRAEFIAADGSHITPAGYAAITSYARPRLESYLSRRP